jgi:16S rRNA (cytosine1402-N4)-methyltransferase
MADSVHVSVLRDEVVSMLRAEQGGAFLDCTLGGGGHSAAILAASALSNVSALDRDQAALDRSTWITDLYPGKFTAKHGTFSAARALYPETQFDGILADLGLSTDQLNEERGFSFNDQSDLDMRMDRSQGESLAELLERVSAQELYVILRQGGVGPEARAVAAALLRHKPFHSSRELANLLQELPALRAKKKKTHPATVVFQALRIAVNREIEEIESFMNQAPKMIKPGGRLAVITFHSLEDRLVTHQMRAWENQGSAPAGYRGVVRQPQLGKVLTRKPILPSALEIERNPASRSAQLRVFEFDAQILPGARA